MFCIKVVKFDVDFSTNYGLTGQQKGLLIDDTRFRGHKFAIDDTRFCGHKFAIGCCRLTMNYELFISVILIHYLNIYYTSRRLGVKHILKKTPRLPTGCWILASEE